VSDSDVWIEEVARKKQWMRVVRAPRPALPALPDEAEKQAIIAACETFIRDFLKPRFLPEIRPAQWNYVVDIRGAWAGGRYRFMQRYRSAELSLRPVRVQP
jgi:hypothetical protein